MSRPKKPHYDTPTKAKVQGAYQSLISHAIPFDPRAIFQEFGVAERAGYNIIKSGASSRTRHNSSLVETRGRKRKISDDQLKEADHILQDQDLQLEGKRYTWDALAQEIGADVMGRTMKRTLTAALNYHKCLSCVEGWLAMASEERREEFATVMLNKYPRSEDWHRVRFSDEIHFGYGPEGQLRIIRKPGTRYRWDCIQHRDAPPEKDRKRKHCWAAVGYNFKSDIYFYDVPSNSNGKMTHQVYIDAILDPVVKPWLERGDDFVLEEDGDSGHGTGKRRNAVKKWKLDHDLEHYFNCSSSPDLAPIENCWQPAKQHVRKFPHWDDASLEQLIREGWARVSQEFINERVLSMPKRLKEVKDAKGAMTGY